MSRLKLSLVLSLQVLVIFTLFRVLLLLAYYDEFSTLTLTEIFLAFIHGLRFDFALFALLLAVPLLMINLPLRYFEHRYWVSGWYWLSFPIVITISLLLVADLAYFAYVKRHISQELWLVLQDASFILKTGLSSYKLALLLFAGFCCLLFVVWFKSSPREIVPARPRHQLASFIIILLVLAIGIRGGVQRKTMHIIDAYTSGSAAQGNLTLNGGYSALRSFDNKPSVTREFFSQQELQQYARQLGLYMHNPDYPFARRYDDKPLNRLNVIIVLLESWSYKYVDALAGHNLGITPNFDQLVNGGLAFTRFYAAGQRSIEGLQAVLTGVPNLIDQPNLGWGLESNKFSRLGYMVRKHGYHTVFAQSSRRTSFHVDGIAAATGFEDYYGMEDMQLKLDYADPESFWYGWDHETFNKVHERLAEIKQPFFSFIFTGSTHSPYGTLPAQFLKYPHDTDSEQGFMNTIYYADWAIGQFMQQARKQPWFDDTLFVFTADHTVGHYGSPNVPEQFHIPLLLYAPKHIKPGRNDIISSHFDIMPTIIDMLGIPEQFSSMGESLLRKQQGVAYIRSGNITGLVSDKGYLRHTLKSVVDARTLDGKKMIKTMQKKLERQLLTVDQLSYQSIHRNHWAQ